MGDYYFLYDILAYVNSFFLIIYSIISIVVFKKSKKKIFKIIALYLMFSFLFDFLINILFFTPKIEIISDTLFLDILYRLGELLIVGYLINNYWLKSKMFWLLICVAGLFLIYDLFTYRERGLLNYVAYAQITANLLLIVLIVTNLLKQLKDTKPFSVTNQMVCMVFLAYFSIHLVYTVVQNFIINQSFTNKSFVVFYSSYAILHILYYFSLAFIVFKNSKNLFKFYKV
ncbi:hypothetical protein [Paenimyroides baculatum]|uniref:YhhN-like protein n=1 Tax=Paenimyroides baculatum TaxID=2608000 RepID=A0A5M6C9I5_9FLAO|nr:hypothetical protein [Paenimyroides baculatum]KAA5531754.1 hypothetical protein F0460_15295 [Paenimyroides baculatum]